MGGGHHVAQAGPAVHRRALLGLVRARWHRCFCLVFDLFVFGRLIALIYPVCFSVSMATWVIVGALSMQLYHRPFRQKTWNNLEAGTLGVLFVRSIHDACCSLVPCAAVLECV